VLEMEYLYMCISAVLPIDREGTAHAAPALQSSYACTAAFVPNGQNSWERLVPGFWNSLYVSFPVGLDDSSARLCASFHQPPHGAGDAQCSV
jgi:hypothetical protein